jgi:spermidine/putrescine transport system permease protein
VASETSLRKGKKAPYGLLTPGMLWLILFFLVPMWTLLKIALSEKPNAFLPDYELTWRWANFSDAIDRFQPELIRSFTYAGIATILCIAIGYPLAYFLAFKAGRWRSLLLGLIMVPFFTSFLIRTIAWQTILGQEGPALGLLRALSLVSVTDAIGLTQDGAFLNTPQAVVGGLTYNFVPFMILPIYVSLEKIDGRLMDAARDLYSTPAEAFRKIVLPLSLPGVFAGTLLTFIPAAGDYINAELLGTPNEYMIGNVIDSAFLVRLDYPQGAALSFLLMAAILAIVFTYLRKAGTEEVL